jgi:hypothetical protein
VQPDEACSIPLYQSDFTEQNSEAALSPDRTSRVRKAELGPERLNSTPRPKAYCITGDFDFLLISNVKDMGEYEQLPRDLFFSSSRV